MMIKRKLLSAIWFGFLSGLSSIVILSSNDRYNETYLIALLFFGFAFPWGYIFGHHIVTDQIKGLWASVYLGAFIVILTYVTLSFTMLLLNFDPNETLESLMGFVHIFLITFLFTFIFTMPIGILGAIILWGMYKFYIKTANNCINSDGKKRRRLC